MIQCTNVCCYVGNIDISSNYAHNFYFVVVRLWLISTNNNHQDYFTGIEAIICLSQYTVQSWWIWANWIHDSTSTLWQNHKNTRTVKLSAYIIGFIVNLVCKEHWLSSQLLTFLQPRSSQPWNYWFQKHITQHTDFYTRAPLLWASSFPKAHAILYVLNTWIIWRHLKIEDRL